jgi:hypothetical protein
MSPGFDAEAAAEALDIPILACAPTIDSIARLARAYRSEKWSRR